ncbi:MAG: FeoB small GTPase domain-containing protein, partial [Planctomycetota bacterium]|nr:FeoB small GTPase domain-containing protein [Planctomycetota bacterium]
MAPSNSAANRIVVAGNPNAGKTSVFNLLTGLNLKVGNYPGVTVDRHSGSLILSGETVDIEDLPGTYSLSARSAEEEIAMRALAGHPPYKQPDLVLLIIDGTQLARNLYLVLQVLELGIPCVCSLNMIDQVEKAGQNINIEALSTALGVPVVPTAARTGQGLDQLKSAISSAIKESPVPPVPPALPSSDSSLAESIKRIGAGIPPEWHRGDPRRRAALARWALLSIDPSDELTDLPDSLRETVTRERNALQEAGEDPDLLLIGPRYAWIDEHVKNFLSDKPDTTPKKSGSERLDRILLHPLLGLPLFLIVMAALFQSLFAWADPMIGFVEGLFGRFAQFVQSH